jgi:dUTP pyrophosphatase
MSEYTLLVKPINDDVMKMYKGHGAFHDGDSGIDLFCPEDIVIGAGEKTLLDLGVQCEMIKTKDGIVNNVSYIMMPRSSISKTPLVEHNSFGLIDGDYRGNLKLALIYPIDKEYMVKFNKYILDCVKEYLDESLETSPEMPVESYTIKKGTRLCQIVAPSLKEFNFKLVDKLSETSRGSEGFGSTGK